MSALELRLLEYDSAWHNVVGRALAGFVADHPLLGRLRHAPGQHRGPIRNVREPQALDMPFQPSVAVAEIKKAHLREGNIEAHTLLVNELANEYVSNAAKLLYSSMDQISEAAGTTYSGKGQTASWDLLLDALERMSVSVDDEGHAEPPLFIVHPDDLARLPPMTEAQRKRHAEILRRKEADHAASKRTRRLPR